MTFTVCLDKSRSSMRVSSSSELKRKSQYVNDGLAAIASAMALPPLSPTRLPEMSPRRLAS